MEQLSRELSFGALLTPGKVKIQNAIATCNGILNYNAMQCNARAIRFFQIKSMPLIVETTREPRSILPLAPILQRHLPSNASLNIEVGHLVSSVSSL